MKMNPCRSVAYLPSNLLVFEIAKRLYKVSADLFKVNIVRRHEEITIDFHAFVFGTFTTIDPHQCLPNKRKNKIFVSLL